MDGSIIIEIILHKICNTLRFLGINSISPHPEPSKYSFTFETSEGRSEFVTNELRKFNRTRGSPLWSRPPQGAPLQVFVLDDQGCVVGGLIGETNVVPGWFEISITWVAEHLRMHGMGRQLMYLAEEEAKRRNCRYARLATSEYQAPGFYNKVGYIQYGRLDNCPEGETVHYFYKEIT